MFIAVVIILAYIGGTTYYANILTRKEITVDHREAGLMRMLLQTGGWMAGLLALFTLFAGVVSNQPVEGEEALPTISALGMVFGIAVSLASATVILMLASSEDFRVWIAGYINRFGGNLKADAPVHITAIVMTVLMVTLTLVLFVVEGGPSGAEESASSVDVQSILLQNALFVGMAALGIGYAIRRDDRSALKRLGLRIPTNDDWTWGAIGGVGFFVVLIIVGIVFTLLFGELNNEAANNQAEALAAIPFLPLLISVILIAVGEEIFFRGALQPVFGNGITTLIFVLLHTQSLLSPLIVVLFALSYMLGWLRDRHSTTAAMIAHFCYNMIQLLLF